MKNPKMYTTFGFFLTRGGGFPPSTGRFFLLQNLVTFLSQFVGGKCQKVLICMSFFGAWFFSVLFSSIQVAFGFKFGHLLHTITSVLRAFGLCALLRTVLRTEVSMFFLQGRLVTRYRGSPDTSICHTGGDAAEGRRHCCRSIKNGFSENIYTKLPPPGP
jgi:hypothetical protein